MENSPFQVSIEDIKALDEKDAVKVFKHLLEAEAIKLGLPLSRIQISENTKAPDGGIDAITIFDDIHKNFEDDILKNSNTIYQIKADNSFSGLSTGSIINELFTGKIKIEEFKNLSNDEVRLLLKPKIKEIVDKGYWYVLVAFRCDSASNKKQEAIDLIKEILIKGGCVKPKIDILDCTNLQLAVNQHLPIVNMIRPLPSGVDSVGQMLLQGDLNETFYTNSKIDDIRNIFKDFLENKNDRRHLRVLAEPGTGKTKAVLEFCKEYNSVVLYAESAEKFDDSEFYSYLKRCGKANLTLIIDECSLDYAQVFFDKFKNRLPDLKLITIYNDFKKNSANSETQVIVYPKLEDEDFANILIEEYGIEKAAAQHIASLCEGYPRLAHYVGKNFRANQTVLSDLDSVLEGIVLASETNEVRKNNILAVLRYCSVFKKFGYSDEYRDEKNFIYNLIKFELPSLTPVEFDNIIRNLKAKKILQQEHTLYISPKILHIWLYGKFWENKERKDQIFNEIDNMPADLKTWFSDMFQYAKNANLSVDIPRELLQRFNFDDLISGEKTDFFLNLAKANSREALNTLLRIFENLSDEDIQKITISRMNLVWAIRQILFEEALFIKGIGILYRLAINETEHVFSNNSTGTLSELFQVMLPGTQASLAARSEILKNFYTNAKTDKEICLLVKIMDCALKTRDFMRMGGFECDGFETKMDYRPKTYGEIFDYYKIILDLLVDAILVKNNRDAFDILFNNIFALIRYNEITCNLIIEKLEIICKSKSIDRTILYKEISKTLKNLKRIKNDNLQPAIVKLEELIKQIEQYSEKCSVEILFDIDSWNIVEDLKNHYDEFINKIANAYKKYCVSLDKNKKFEFLKTCVQRKYKNDFCFGVAVAKIDNAMNLPNEFITFYKESDNKEGLFIVGYLTEIYKKTPEKYDEIIQKLYDLELYVLVININAQANKTDASSRFAFNALNTGKVPADKISKFIWGIDNMPDDIINGLLVFSLDNKTPEVIKAIIEILHFSEKVWSIKNNDIIYDILDNTVIRDQNCVITYAGDYYIWTSVIIKFIENNPPEDQIFQLFDKILDFIAGAKKHYFISDYMQTAFSLIIEKNPKRSWQLISKYLDKKTILFNPIKEWLRGDDSFGHDIKGAMSKFSIEDIFNWIDEDENERLILIACCCPKDLFKGGDIIKSLIIKYHDNKNLYHQLHINYGNKGWCGKESDNIKKDLAQAEQTKKNETNIYVLEFINQYIEYLHKDLKRALMREEREEF